MAVAVSVAWVYILVVEVWQCLEPLSVNQSLVSFFDIDKCCICSRRKRYYKEDAKCKTYLVQIKSVEILVKVHFQRVMP